MVRSYKRKYYHIDDGKTPFIKHVKTEKDDGIVYGLGMAHQIKFFDHVLPSVNMSTTSVKGLGWNPFLNPTALILYQHKLEPWSKKSYPNHIMERLIKANKLTFGGVDLHVFDYANTFDDDEQNLKWVDEIFKIQFYDCQDDYGSMWMFKWVADLPRLNDVEDTGIIHVLVVTMSEKQFNQIWVHSHVRQHFQTFFEHARKYRIYPLFLVEGRAENILVDGVDQFHWVSVLGAENTLFAKSYWWDGYYEEGYSKNKMSREQAGIILDTNAGVVVATAGIETTKTVLVKEKEALRRKVHEYRQEMFDNMQDLYEEYDAENDDYETLLAEYDDDDLYGDL